MTQEQLHQTEQYLTLNIMRGEYTRQTGGVWYNVKITRGRALKPYVNVSFPYIEGRERYIQEQKDNIKFWEDAKEKRRAERRNFKHTLKEGDILDTCWGYEQTNREFYQVVRVEGKSVILRELSQEKEYTQYMAGNCKPIKDKFIGEEFKRSVLVGNRVRINDIVTASLFDGKYLYFSEYA